MGAPKDEDERPLCLVVVRQHLGKENYYGKSGQIHAPIFFFFLLLGLIAGSSELMSIF